MAWLVVAIIISALMSTTTLSRYMTTVSGTGTATVAAVAMEGSTVTFTTDKLKPGGEATYTFNVVNFTGEAEKVSDVAQTYTITVSDLGNLPLTYTLSAATIAPSSGGGSGASGLGTDGTVTATAGSLPHTTATTHQYTLTASWPNTNEAKNPAYADEIDLITVTVDALQAMPAVAGP